MPPVSAKIDISGIVQGVGFRPFIYRIARRLALDGYVRNLGDAGVEILVEGEKEKIERFLDIIERDNPENARIDQIDVKWYKAEGLLRGFKIIESGGFGIPGVLPADISVCDECVKEIFLKDDRRYMYPFTTCTDCGPRFSTIRRVPYDRRNTAFDEFPMCEKCRKEYEDPDNRRFHAQTIACPDCGPHYSLLNRRFERIENPVENAINFLEQGKILCIKGIGGMHIASKTTNEDIIQELRKRIKRLQQPFAIMALDTDMVRSFAIVSEDEKRVLESKERPIVVLQKSDKFWLADGISPGLDSIGVMLPYTGMHHILLRGIKEPLVMTSANMPGEPMIIENEEVKNLGIADYFLLHNLKITNRVDDSVIKFVNNQETFIRRSRGFVPVPVELGKNSENTILALGGEENTTACLLRGNRAFLTQYIGDTNSPDTMNYLRDSVNHLLRLTDSKVDVLACDLHPNFNTTRFAEELSKKNRIPLVKVQHHYAHIASLIAESNLNRIVGISVDGYGYGEDGNAWGGEIILYKNKKFLRIGHLKEQRMPGGDTAAYFPARMVLGILYDLYPPEELKDILIRNRLYLRHGKKEIDVVLKQIEEDVNVPRTTSMGRVLDAISSLLGICHYRTYEGEPAMKLDSVGNKGKKLIEFPVLIKKGILNTTEILNRVLELKEEGYKKEDIAYSAEVALAKGIAEIAVKQARIHGIKTIGISGGVAFNNVIVKTVSGYVSESGLKFLQHRRVPPGDGGISLGQVRYSMDYPP